MFGLRVQRELLYTRINQRTDKMFVQGAVEEVKKLLKLNLSLTAEKIIGVSEIKKFLDNEITSAQAKEQLKQNTRNFAKRQLTWFNRNQHINWVDVDNKTVPEIAQDILNKKR